MSACDKTVRLIAEARGRDLAPEEAQFLRQHAAVCRECAEHIEAAGTAAALMHTVLPPEIEPPSGFADRLRERLLERNGRPRWYSYMPQIRFRPAELALLAGLFVFAAAIAAYFTIADETPEPRLVTERMVPADTPLSIDLEYLAVRDIPAVSVTIELDEGVRFHSDYAEVAGARSHTWVGSFTEGMNTVPFMVTVDKPGLREIRTRADFEGWRHEHLITLTSTGKMVTMAMYRLPNKRM